MSLFKKHSTNRLYINAVALVGGGTNPMLGEITLTHNGVLSLDEFPECLDMAGVKTL